MDTGKEHLCGICRRWLYRSSERGYNIDKQLIVRWKRKSSIQKPHSRHRPLKEAFVTRCTQGHHCSRDDSGQQCRRQSVVCTFATFCMERTDTLWLGFSFLSVHHGYFNIYFIKQIQFQRFPTSGNQDIETHISYSMHRMGNRLVWPCMWRWLPAFCPSAHSRGTATHCFMLLCYFFFTALFMNHKFIPALTFILLVSYTVILCMGNGYACDESNILSIIDRQLFGEAHLYQKSPIDPEGFVSTLSAIAHTCIGFSCGKWIIQSHQTETKYSVCSWPDSFW